MPYVVRGTAVVATRSTLVSSAFKTIASIGQKALTAVGLGSSVAAGMPSGMNSNGLTIEQQRLLFAQNNASLQQIKPPSSNAIVKTTGTAVKGTAKPAQAVVTSASTGKLKSVLSPYDGSNVGVYVESAGGVSVQPVVKPSYSTIGSQLAAAELLATTQAITLAQEIQTNPLKVLGIALAVGAVALGGWAAFKR